jgi:drug/metabolite transporter (DMT)-like permease
LLQKKQVIKGVGFAVLATLIWSGNFVIARGVYSEISPVNLSFGRWSVATIVIFPFAFKKVQEEWSAIKVSWHYLIWAAVFGVSLFNTFVYIAGHYTSAINLALIGTTTSPIISIILARIFLKEKIGVLKITGLVLCIIGILFLLSRGKVSNLIHLKFSSGDAWMLVAAFCFAVYNTLVRKKPAGISTVSFLFVTFFVGSLFLLPFFIGQFSGMAFKVDYKVITSILYLGIGASVVSFFLWNISISILGSGRTALFGNLIPVFSSLEAMVILDEKFSWIHLISMILVFSGLLLANLQLMKTFKKEKI